MTQTIKKLSTANRLKPVILGAFFAVMFLAAGWRVYLIGDSISSAIDSQNNIKKMTSLERQKTELESRYMNLTAKFDINYALENNFTDQSKKIIYVSRSGVLVQR